MSFSRTCSKILGQASLAQPCSVMSMYTPVAMSWSTARSTSTCTPWRIMMAALASTMPSVWLSSGERLSVQLMNIARRSEKSVLSVSSTRFGAASVGVVVVIT